MLISALLRLAVIPLLGIPLTDMAFYFPDRLDRWMRALDGLSLALLHAACKRRSV